MLKNAIIYYDDLDMKIFLGDLAINILYIRYEPPRPTWNVDNHFHTAYELHFVPEGSGTLWIEGNSYDIVPNTFYITGPNVYHEQKTNPKMPMSEFVISFDISEYKRPNPNKRYFDIQEIGAVLSAYSNTGFWIGKDEYHNISLFKKIFWELERKQTGYMFNVQSLCTQIIVNAARSCMTKKESANIMPTKMKDDKRRFLLDFYFGECYKYLTFRKLAANLNVSERQLNRIIRKLYNTTFNEKLTSIKVQNAIHLLQTTNMTAEEISEQVGFANPSYFFRVFKKHCNMPPMEYKLQKILALNKGSAVD